MTDRRWDQDSLTRLMSTGGRWGLWAEPERPGRPPARPAGLPPAGMPFLLFFFRGILERRPCHQRESIRLNIALGPGKGPGGVPRAVTVPEGGRQLIAPSLDL